MRADDPAFQAIVRSDSGVLKERPVKDVKECARALRSQMEARP